MEKTIAMYKNVFHGGWREIMKKSELLLVFLGLLFEGKVIV